MIPPQALARLATLGLTPEQAEGVVEIIRAIVASYEARSDRRGKRSRARIDDQPDAVVPGCDVMELFPDTPTVTKPPPRGTRLPEDWQAGAAETAFAIEEGFSHERIARLAAEFGDYWRARPGAAGRKLDWPATWRNWCRKTADRERGHGAPPRSDGRGYRHEPASYTAVALRRIRAAGD